MLIERCQFSRLYHQKRESFFAFTDNFCTAVSLISGAAVIAKIFGENNNEWFGLVVLILTTIQLIFSLKDKAKLHNQLSTDFKRLEAKKMAIGVLSATDIDIFKSELLSIEVDEPPDLGILVRICQNELEYAAGRYDNITLVPWYKRWFAHVIPFSNISLRDVRRHQETREGSIDSKQSSQP